MDPESPGKIEEPCQVCAVRLINCVRDNWKPLTGLETETCQTMGVDEQNVSAILEKYVAAARQLTQSQRDVPQMLAAITNSNIPMRLKLLALFLHLWESFKSTGIRSDLDEPDVIADG